jgi:hypothetical protein
LNFSEIFSGEYHPAWKNLKNVKVAGKNKLGNIARKISNGSISIGPGKNAKGE